MFFPSLPTLPPTIYQTCITLPGFGLRLSAQGEALISIEFLPLGSECLLPPDAIPDKPTHLIPPQETRGVLAQANTEITQWLHNPAHRFSLPVRLHGTPFRQRVWQAIAAIPYGQTRRYGELARLLGSAPRAIGQACGDNPLPIIIPCHRVVGSRGAGGFNHSTSQTMLLIKDWLLRRENPERGDKSA